MKISRRGLGRITLGAAAGTVAGQLVAKAARWQSLSHPEKGSERHLDLPDASQGLREYP